LSLRGIGPARHEIRWMSRPPRILDAAEAAGLPHHLGLHPGIVISTARPLVPRRSDEKHRLRSMKCGLEAGGW
jgi:hypothetical protein